MVSNAYSISHEMVCNRHMQHVHPASGWHARIQHARGRARGTQQLYALVRVLGRALIAKARTPSSLVRCIAMVLVAAGCGSVHICRRCCSPGTSTT